jgi:L-alanine-DL-glutamate epimerase-like enolase superfamily enzyme
VKIVKVEAPYLKIPFPEPGIRTVYDGGKSEKHFGVGIVKVHTDDGLVGYGAQRTAFEEWTSFVERIARPLLMESIVEPYYVEKFARYIRVQPAGTYAGVRLCAVESALWDLIGKKAGLPVYKLLGAYQNKVKAYASVLGEYPLMTTEQWVQFCEKLYTQGFKAIKLHIGYLWPNPDKVIEVIAAIRKKLGNKIDIMVDAMQAWEPHPLYDLRTTIAYARALESYNVLWLEEPVPHFNNPELSSQLCQAVDIPIAGGGALFGLHSYRYVLEKGALDIVQPDIQQAGGILEVRRIALLAESYGRVCIPHFFGPGIALAATLQVIGASDIGWIEYNYHPPAWSVETRDCMLKEPIRIDEEGYVKIPDKPGLGVEVKEDVIDKYTTK